MIMVLVDYLVGVPSPKLNVPDRFEVTPTYRRLMSDLHMRRYRALTEPFVRPAHVQHSRVADLSSGTEPLVDNAGSRCPRPALHHPHLHGPTDHRRHHQQEGEQAQGLDHGTGSCVSDGAGGQ